MQSIIPFVNRSSVCPSSQPILDRQFSYEALVSAAVGTEILLLGKNWCHARDQRRRGSFQSISVVKRLNRVFLKDLDELVAGEKPLILAKGFSRGLTRRVLDDIENSMVVRANGHNDRIVKWPHSHVERMKPLANGRLLVKWIRQHMLSVFPCEGLQEGLAPLDLAEWLHVNGGEWKDPEKETNLLRRYMLPWSECRGFNLDKAIGGFFRIRNLAESFRQQGEESIPSYWGAACRARDALKTYPDTVAFLQPGMSQWLGNGDLEGDFSVLKALGMRSRGLGYDLRRAAIKVRLDGPSPEELLPIGGGSHPWLIKVQRMYTRLFGEVDLAGRESRGIFVRVDTGVKRPHLWRGAEEERRKRQKQLDALRRSAPDGDAREPVLGLAPTRAEAQVIVALPEDLLNHDAAAKAKFSKIAETGRRYAKKLQRDRLSAEQDVAMRERLAKEVAISAAEVATRKEVLVTSPELDLRNRRMLYVPHAGVFCFGPRIPEATRKVFESLDVRVTTQAAKALPEEKKAPANLIYVDNVSEFLEMPRNSFAWRARVLGAGIVDATWAKVVKDHRALPAAMVRFNGLREVRHVHLHSTFTEEQPYVASLLALAMRMWLSSKHNWNLVGDVATEHDLLLVGAPEKQRMLEALKAKAKAKAKPAPGKKQIDVWDCDELWTRLSGTRGKA